jgi:hypothetical protein
MNKNNRSESDLCDKVIRPAIGTHVVRLRRPGPAPVRQSILQAHLAEALIADLPA